MFLRPEHQGDPELNLTLRELWLSNRQHQDQIEDMARNNGEEGPNPQLVSDFGNPGAYTMSGGIRVPNNRTNYQIHPNYINLVKNDQFSGRRDECPMEHLDKFMEDCQGAITNQVTSEYVFMTLFRHSLKGLAKTWFNDLAPDSLQTWDEVVKAFLKKFYPPWKTAEARRNISNFEQDDDESLGEARERFRYMLRRCPHHGFDTGLRVRFFYDGLSPISKQNLDAGAGGQLNKVPLNEAEGMMDDICRNYSNERRRDKSIRKVKFEDEPNLMSMVQESVEKVLGKRQAIPEKVASAGQFSCDLCGGTNHDRTYCGGADFERVAAMGYREPPSDQGYRGNSSSGWRNDGYKGPGNSYWRDEQQGNRGGQGNSWREQNQGSYGRFDNKDPPFQSNQGNFGRGFNNGGGSYQHPNARGPQYQAPPNVTQPPPAPQQNETMDALLQQLKALNQNMDKQGQQMAEQDRQIKNLERREKEYLQHVKMIEKQLAQVASDKASASNTPLPAQPYPNPSGDHHQIKSVTLRSGTSYEGPKGKEMEETVDEGIEVDVEVEERGTQLKEKEEGGEKNVSRKSEKGKTKPPTYDRELEPSPPYPHRLVERKLGDKFNKFLELMKGLQVNMPFLQAIAQMPTYAKFLKDLLSNKSRLEEAELITLPHQVSAILQKTMPRKHADPGRFILPVRIGDLESMGALADLGAGVSLMPLCVAKQLTFELEPTRKTIQLADRSIRVPDGQLVDIPIRVGHLIVPCDFIVVDMEPDPVTPLILGREALKTLGAVINCKDNTITIEVANEAVVFQFSKHLRRPMEEKGDICQLQVIEDGLGAIEGEGLDEDGTELDIVEEQVFA